MAMKSAPFIFPAIAAILATAFSMASGAVSITEATYTGTFTPGSPEVLTGDATLTSITVDGVIYSSLTGATSVFAAGETFWVGTTPANDSASMVGLTASAGLLNLSAASTFQLGSGFTANTRFFLIEASGNFADLGDPATITLINASNAVVGDYSYSLLKESFGVSLGSSTANREGGGTVGLALSGVSFSLADFIGTTGDLSTVTGIRINSGSGLDPAVVGLYTVPEPSRALLFLCGAGLLMMRRRR